LKSTRRDTRGQGGTNGQEEVSIAFCLGARGNNKLGQNRCIPTTTRILYGDVQGRTTALDWVAEAESATNESKGRNKHKVIVR
jgi:hypothetical protein